MITWMAVLPALFFLAAGCSKDASGTAKAGDQRKQMAVPVTAGVAVAKTVPVQLRAIGNVQAYATVAVKSQVEGELMGVHFQEGQEVKAGDLLFTIDPRVYAAQLKQAEANLAKDKAQLTNAKKQVERYGSVVKKGFVPEEQYDQMVASASALEASAKANEAAIENARLKVAFCTIRSPMNGVVGGIKVHRGNILKANDNDRPLVIINQINPIYLSFYIPERNLPEIKKYMAGSKLEVDAILPGEDGESIRGELAFIENTVNTETGSIQLKGIFSNEGKKLWPGQFVNVVLTLTTQTGMVVVPSQAVQTGQQGQYVFVVKDDLTVEYRPVTVGRAIDGEVVITKGISPGEKMVTDGQLRLAAGSLVKIVQDGGKQE
jgi:multidrug efflux system membrane fusion protein